MPEWIMPATPYIIMGLSSIGVIIFGVKKIVSEKTGMTKTVSVKKVIITTTNGKPEEGE